MYSIKKYFCIFKVALSNNLEYRANFISSLLFSLAPFGVNTLLWIAVANQNKDMLMNVEEIITYYFVTIIVSNLTGTVAVSKVSDDIRLGDLNKYLLKPYSYCIFQLMSDLPRRFAFIILNCLPLLILFFLLQRFIVIQFNIINFLGFTICIIFGYLINFLLDFIISLYCFYFSAVSSIYASINILRNIVAGNIFPLLFLPEIVLRITDILPFPYTSYIPTMILLGNYDSRNVFKNILVSLLWVLLLIVFSKILWKKGLKHYAAFGG